MEVLLRLVQREVDSYRQLPLILFRTDTLPGPEVHAGLKERGVLIKNLHGSSPLLENCLRVTVSTPQENSRFLEALTAVL